MCPEDGQALEIGCLKPSPRNLRSLCSAASVRLQWKVLGALCRLAGAAVLWVLLGFFFVFSFSSCVPNVEVVSGFANTYECLISWGLSSPTPQLMENTSGIPSAACSPWMNGERRRRAEHPLQGCRPGGFCSSLCSSLEVCMAWKTFKFVGGGCSGRAAGTGSYPGFWVSSWAGWWVQEGGIHGTFMGSWFLEHV